eukprot:scaffold28834_cov78-Skeletonema_dohrnii-CCMP3373.AAC.1
MAAVARLLYVVIGLQQLITMYYLYGLTCGVGLVIEAENADDVDDFQSGIQKVGECVFSGKP